MANNMSISVEKQINMRKKYPVKLSVLLESIEYCSDVESDGYYVVKDTYEIIEYGEDLSDIMDDETNGETNELVISDKCLQLPTLHDIDNYDPNWNQTVTLKYIHVMIADEKQKKMLTKAYKSIFRNRIFSAFPGSPKFDAMLGKLGKLEEWHQFTNDEYSKHQLKFIKKWCEEHNVEIIYDNC